MADDSERQEAPTEAEEEGLRNSGYIASFAWPGVAATGQTMKRYLEYVRKRKSRHWFRRGNQRVIAKMTNWRNGAAKYRPDTSVSDPAQHPLAVFPHQEFMNHDEE